MARTARLHVTAWPGSRWMRAYWQARRAYWCAFAQTCCRLLFSGTLGCPQHYSSKRLYACARVCVKVFLTHDRPSVWQPHLDSSLWPSSAPRFPPRALAAPANKRLLKRASASSCRRQHSTSSQVKVQAYPAHRGSCTAHSSLPPHRYSGFLRREAKAVQGEVGFPPDGTERAVQNSLPMRRHCIPLAIHWN